MGFFAPPRENIRKTIPIEALRPYESVEYIVYTRLEDIPRPHIDHAIAFIMSVWVCNSVALGEFILTPRQHKKVQMLGLNSTKFMKPKYLAKTAVVLDELIEAGTIPRPHSI